MICTTYIDESGNTGDDLTSKDQRYFTLAAVTVPDDAITETSRFFEMAYNSVREKEETEIKATKWVKSLKKCDAMKAILDCLIAHQTELALVLIEKRFMISAIIVDNFLDGAYNDIEDYTWVNNMDEKKLAAQYFYDLLSDEDTNTVFEAFRRPDFDALLLAYDIVVRNTKDVRYLAMLKGCKNHLQELYDDDTSTASSFAGAGVSRSPNYTAFTALGCMVAKQCRSNGRCTKMLFDHCRLVDQPYEDLYKMFVKAEITPELEALTKLVSWKDIVTDFSVSNSKSVSLLQSADIVATSTLKTMQKVFEGQALSQYDTFIESLLAQMLLQDNFLYVMSEEKIKLMAKSFYGNKE